jgi:Matrixin
MNNNKQILSGWQIGVLMASAFLLSTSAGFARSLFFYDGQNSQPTVGGNYYYSTTPYYGGSADYYGANSGAASIGGLEQASPEVRSGAYREYRAWFAPSAVPNYRDNGAADYLSSVIKEGTYTWPADKLPVKIFIGDGTGVSGYKPVFQDYVRNGFDTWCAASGNKLSWVEVNDPKKADVTVRWTTAVTERPEGTEAGRTSALTKYNTSTGKGIIYGARMQFLTQLPNRRFADQEVEKTCLHEAGHALGLQGHSPYRNDIMYYAVGPSQQPRLTDRDRNTMAKLYASYPAVDAVALSGKAATAATAAAAAPVQAATTP